MQKICQNIKKEEKNTKNEINNENESDTNEKMRKVFRQEQCTDEKIGENRKKQREKRAAWRKKGENWMI